jgi:hypothetical protein
MSVLVSIVSMDFMMNVAAVSLSKCGSNFATLSTVYRAAPLSTTKSFACTEDCHPN